MGLLISESMLLRSAEDWLGVTFGVRPEDVATYHPVFKDALLSSVRTKRRYPGLPSPPNCPADQTLWPLPASINVGSQQPRRVDSSTEAASSSPLRRDKHAWLSSSPVTAQGEAVSKQSPLSCVGGPEGRGNLAADVEPFSPLTPPSPQTPTFSPPVSFFSPALSAPFRPLLFSPFNCGATSPPASPRTTTDSPTHRIITNRTRFQCHSPTLGLGVHATALDPPEPLLLTPPVLTPHEAGTSSTAAAWGGNRGERRWKDSWAEDAAEGKSLGGQKSFFGEVRGSGRKLSGDAPGGTPEGTPGETVVGRLLFGEDSESAKGRKREETREREDEEEKRKEGADSPCERTIEGKSRRESELGWKKETVCLLESGDGVQAADEPAGLMPNRGDRASSSSPPPFLPHPAAEDAAAAVAANKASGGLPAFLAGQVAGADRCRVLAEDTGRLEEEFEVGEVLGSGHFGCVRVCRNRLSGQLLACKSIDKAKLRYWEDREDVRREVAVMCVVGGDGGGAGGNGGSTGKAAGQAPGGTGKAEEQGKSAGGAAAAGRSGGGKVGGVGGEDGFGGCVRLQGVLEDSAAVHLVMDLCEGGELFDAVVARGRLEEDEARHVMVQVAAAVHHCHSLGVLHRDLKPENILLTHPPSTPLPSPSPTTSPEPAAHPSSTSSSSPSKASSPPSPPPFTPLPPSSSSSSPSSSSHASLLSPPVHVKLADFGLSVFLPPGQLVKGLAGSPYYLAPEVPSGWYGFPADVWSMGVVLYLMLSGHVPYYGGTDGEILRAIEVGSREEEEEEEEEGGEEEREEREERGEEGTRREAGKGGRAEVKEWSEGVEGERGGGKRWRGKGVWRRMRGKEWEGVSEEAKDLVAWMLRRRAEERPSALQVLLHPWMQGGRVMGGKGEGRGEKGEVVGGGGGGELSGSSGRENACIGNANATAAATSGGSSSSSSSGGSSSRQRKESRRVSTAGSSPPAAPPPTSFLYPSSTSLLSLLRSSFSSPRDPFSFPQPRLSAEEAATLAYNTSNAECKPSPLQAAAVQACVEPPMPCGDDESEVAGRGAGEVWNRSEEVEWEEGRKEEDAWERIELSEEDAWERIELSEGDGREYTDSGCGSPCNGSGCGSGCGDSSSGCCCGIGAAPAMPSQGRKPQRQQQQQQHEEREQRVSSGSSGDSHGLCGAEGYCCGPCEAVDVVLEAEGEEQEGGGSAASQEGVLDMGGKEAGKEERSGGSAWLASLAYGSNACTGLELAESFYLLL